MSRADITMRPCKAARGVFVCCLGGGLHMNAVSTPRFHMATACRCTKQSLKRLRIDQVQDLREHNICDFSSATLQRSSF